MQTLIVILCVIAAALFMGRKFYLALRKGSRCQGGETGKCCGCPASSSCAGRNPLRELRPRQ